MAFHRFDTIANLLIIHPNVFQSMHRSCVFVLRACALQLIRSLKYYMSHDVLENKYEYAADYVLLVHNTFLL